MDENTSISFLLRVLFIGFRNQVNQRTRNLELTSTQIEILLYLATRQQEHVSLKEIASFMELSHPTVIEVIKRLEQKGYVLNTPDQKDRRCRNIQLTEKAFALQKEIKIYRDEMDELLLDKVDQKEVEQLRKILLHMLKNLIKFSSK